jgi:VWFA-related protein
MTRTVRSVAYVLIVAGSGLSAQQPAQPSQPARYETATAAVVVDVVARDRRGPVTDLAQTDFEVYEDGQLQQIVTFERRAPDALATTIQGVPSVGTGTGTGDAGGPPVVIALAWDRMTPEARALAYKAAQAFVGKRRPSELVGVFVVDQALRVVEGYTTDPARLKSAVDRVAGTATTQTGREANATRDNRVAHPSVPVTPSPEFASGSVPSSTPPNLQPGPGSDPAATAGDQREVATRRALDRMDRSYRDLQSNIEGQASMNALLALVDSLGTLPGRKTVVYFCEGLTVAPAVEARFRSIIATANRKNVSVYALDTAGLRAHSKQAETANEIGALASATVAGVERDEGRKWSEDLERNEEILKMDPSASLGILTSQTGGILIQNTNALDRGIDQINDDRRNYYALTYVPTNSAMDGTYRKISVKVKRPGIALRARSGYLAVPANEPAPVLTFEAPALAAITSSPRPTSFAVQTRALSVPMPGNLGMTALIAGFSGEAVTFTEDPKLKTYAGEATVLARITDASGTPVAKQSQHYQLTGQIDQLPKVKAGTLIFFRTPDLLPGEFTVTTAVHDPKGKRSSVVEAKVEVPGGTSPVIGSLFVVARAERLDPKDAGAASHPLAGGGVLLYPSFGDPISRKAQAEIAFAVPMVIEPGSPLPTAILELMQNGQSLAKLPLPLDKPDEKGRLLQVSRLPSAAIPPGTYELRITIAGGTVRAVRTAPLTLVE